MTSHDWLLFRRTLSVCFAVLAVSALLVVATDEAYSTLERRVARLCAFAPLIAGVACFTSVNIARRRGELTALEALGASPWAAAWGALAAAWLFGGLASLLLLTPLADVASLFPEPPVISTWRPDGAGFREPARGIRVVPDGTLSFVAKQAATLSVKLPDKVDALSAVLPEALVLPAWVLAPLRLRTRVWGLVSTLALTLLGLHAVAIGYIPEHLLLLVAAPLGAQLAFALERGRIQVALFSAMLGRGARRRA